LGGISDRRYRFYSGERTALARRALKAFLEVQPFVGLLVARVFQGSEARFRGGEEARSVAAIEKYLSWGVVPATIIRDGRAFRPDPVILINATYRFYLEGIPTLVSRINQPRRVQLQIRFTTRKMGSAGRAMDHQGAGGSSLAKQEKTMAILVKRRQHGVLTSGEMKERLACDIDDPSSLVVTPLLEEEDAFDIDSIDLRLGTHFLFPRVPPRAYFCPDEDSRHSFHMSDRRSWEERLWRQKPAVLDRFVRMELDLAS
jgi:hypothetical protein